jgi:hypothetical protein
MAHEHVKSKRELVMQACKEATMLVTARECGSIGNVGGGAREARNDSWSPDGKLCWWSKSWLVSILLQGTVCFCMSSWTLDLDLEHSRLALERQSAINWTTNLSWYKYGPFYPSISPDSLDLAQNSRFNRSCGRRTCLRLRVAFTLRSSRWFGVK